jgi:hypothetical protein
MTSMIRAPLACVLASLALACGSSSGGGTPGGAMDAGLDSATTTEGGAPDASRLDGSDEGGSTTYPAFMPSMPQMQKGTISVITNPVVVPVYFMGETLQPSLDTALSSWLASQFFTASVSEYGVHGGTAGTSIALTEAAGTPLADTDIETWLEGKLDGTHPQFGAVDATTLASEVFVLYYPSATAITLQGTAHSCQDFTAYHAGVMLTGGAIASYIVLPRCAPTGNQTAIDALTEPLTSMVVSAATDPITSLTPATAGWAGFDTPHAVFGAFGGEVGTACESLDAVTPTGLSLSITRSWSNAAAAAYHDPCLPSPMTPYFVSVPDATDDVTVGSLTTKGIAVPAGQMKTIDVQLLSDAATTGPWTVLATAPNGAGAFTYALDSSIGLNGDTLHLTVTAPTGAAQHDQLFVASSLGGVSTSFWFVDVASQ